MSDSARTSLELQTKHRKEGISAPSTLRKAHPSSTDSGRQSDGPRSQPSTNKNDAGNKRRGENQPSTRSVEELKSRRPKENSSTSDEHELEGSIDAQPSTTESLSRKSTGDSAQLSRGGSSRSSPRISAQLPPGAAAPTQPGRPILRQELEQTPAAPVVTTGSQKAADDSAMPSVPGDLLSEINPDEIHDRDSALITSEVRRKTIPEVDDDEDDCSLSQSDSDTPPIIEGSGVSSGGVLGGIATALGMRPATAKEAKLERDNHRLRDENRMFRMDYANVERAARKYYNDAFRFHHENTRLQETLEAMALEVKGITKRYEEAKVLSDTRGKELLGAQVFLTKADALSMSELIQKVEGLNDEIYQAAASLGETIVLKKVEVSEQAHYSPEESSIAKTVLGSPLCKVLKSQARKPDEGINPLLVQITLQAFFVVFCIRRIRGWTPSNVDFDLSLQALYEKIWFSSNQAVSGRWRALTRAQLKVDTSDWVKELLTELDAILAVASWEISTPEDRNTLEARLPSIFKVVLDVREATGEKFTSADIEVGDVQPTTPYNKAYMEESYEADGEGPEGAPKTVIATVGMGLRKFVPYQGGRHYEFVLGPKVVLESSLKALLEPPPARPTRSKSTRR